MTNNPIQRAKIFRIVTILGVLLSAVVFLTWRDMSTGVPKFDELQVVTANSFRPDFGRDPLLRGGRASIEFFDDMGHRFQTPRISDEELGQIKNALVRNIPVHIRYGDWMSPFPSTKIFTIYQLEIGDAVIIPYERLALAKQKEQDHKVFIISMVVLGSCGAIYFGVKRGMRVHRSPSANNTIKS